MAKEVILTPLALRDFEKVIEYLMENWGMDVVDNFVERFEKVTELLSTDADLYQFYNLKRNLQKCVLTKHNLLFFTQKENFVYIHAIFDTRQDPDRLIHLL